MTDQIRGTGAIAVDPFGGADPVAAVLEAHDRGHRIALATSGTTTRPRVVVRTTQSWWRSFEPYGALTGVAAGARLWLPGPLTATMNLFAAVHANAVGATLADGPADATHACLTPAQLQRLDPSALRHARVCVAGAALPEGLTAGNTVCYYGSAELSFVAAGRHVGDLRPFPGVDVQIRDGEIWARSAYLSDGYRPGDAGPLRTDDAGYATVGDIGAWRGDALVVHGRPEYVTSAGATVSIAEVEAALAPHARGAFAVFASPHPSIGEVVALAVTEPRDADTLRAAAAHLLPTAMRPRRFAVLDALPLTSAGKVDRRALARRHA